jgi:hypothetical protein
MTADLVKGKGFRGALRYNLQKMEQLNATLLDSSFVRMNEQDVMKEIAMVRMLRPNLQKYFYHTSLNFPPDENLHDDKMLKIAKEYLESMGFDQHQYVIFRHFDAGHPHVHLLVNRIGYDGSLVSDSKDYARTESILRKLEKKNGLTPVISSKQAQERATTKNELELVRRKNKPSSKQKLQILIKAITNNKPTTEEFIKALEKQGVNVLFNQASTGFVSGISFGYEGLLFKGAHLGQAYKWLAVKNSIDYEPERDRQAISQGNIRTRNAKLTRAEEGNISGTNTAAAVRAGRDAQATGEFTRDTPSGAGALQTGNVDAGSGNRQENGGIGNEDTGHQQDVRGSGTEGESRQRTEQLRQPLAHPALPYLDLIERLIGPDDTADHLDEKTLSELAKRKKKRKQQKSHL